jgi:threonine aldolase
VQRLAQDHDNAAALARGLSGIEALKVGTLQTNIFWMDVPAAACEPLRQALASQRIRATVGPRMRLVTHLDVSCADIERTVDVFKTFFAGWQA